ncbi:MAG: acyl-CoA dehydrogenase family protein [Alphaproteobacteria bacterium]|nr:acyl-CoA dehydrogenase family protein [Alphaproteobacteria bacterium]MDP6566635.1 acyl-CoA dehydrogenase family protein [Alphaproteobacteria bacterium]MDP6811999.1 acyl-CoA dehydrogenase family protein [Alphaproteobacteria bacterium]
MIPNQKQSPYYTDEHEAFRATVRRFVEREVEPYVAEWDEAEEFPREMYKKASELGLLQLGYPEEYGGIACDRFYGIILSQELARAGCGGLSASLMSHTIGTPHLSMFGSDELKARVLPPVLAGEKIAALAVTEPSGGSDVAALKTTARRDGDDYVVNGQKMFITSGFRADFYTVAVRTGGPGLGGISLLLIERDRPGFDRTKLKKMGWWASDTAALYFDDVRVPTANLIGEENQGFKAIMHNFNYERLGMAASALGYAQTCLDEASAYGRERHTFGKPLIENQVIRHKLVDMAMRINSGVAYLEDLTWRDMQGERIVADVCMLKVHATSTMEFCANEAMQILGGAGYMRGGKVERIYRETKVMAIGGGSAEIMKDLAARQMGL